MEINFKQEKPNLEKIKPSKSTFQKIYRDFMSIFSIDKEKLLIEYLEESNIPTKQVCAKILKKGKILIFN